MLYRLYEWWIARYLESIPPYLCFMISEDDMIQDPGKITDVVRWTIEISDEIVRHHPQEKGVASITIHISTRNADDTPPYIPAIEQIGSIARLILHVGSVTIEKGNGIPVAVAVGKSGREEIIDAIRRMAVESVDPDGISEKKIEEYLTFHHTPDFVIKTGGSHLVDFLIWQSVYSELFFLDLNWESLRKVDLLRAFRDYLSRGRRFGT